jgi:alkanesulfonate monooxygenase SsuD/methylene tetrahydromethanopterin reductase-like flavin-dependent oxidoreductase (luciferase family)
MDHYWMERGGARVGGQEPIVGLTLAAARTRRIRLGTLVLCNSFRHPGQLAREAAALADASGGRFVLGIGAGWHEPEYEAFGIPFDHRAGRLEETLEALPRLLAGDTVSRSGRFLALRDAHVVTTAPPPPIWVAGGSPRMLDLAARCADGWNVAWLGPDPAPFRTALAALRERQAAAGRPAEAVTASVGLFAMPVEGDELESARRRDARLRSDPLPFESRVVAGSPAAVVQRVRAYAEAGADEVILCLSSAPFSRFDPSFLERAGEVVRLLREGG